MIIVSLVRVILFLGWGVYVDEGAEGVVGRGQGLSASVVTTGV
jgi:hypothetical protein